MSGFLDFKRYSNYLNLATISDDNGPVPISNGNAQHAALG